MNFPNFLLVPYEKSCYTGIIPRAGEIVTNHIIADGQRFVDEPGRERIFSGINIVDKSEFSPGTQTFLNIKKSTIAGLSERGFNLIRLGFTWAKAEPLPGCYNEPYPDAVGEIPD